MFSSSFTLSFWVWKDPQALSPCQSVCENNWKNGLPVTVNYFMLIQIHSYDASHRPRSDTDLLHSPCKHASNKPASFAAGIYSMLVSKWTRWAGNKKIKNLVISQLKEKKLNRPFWQNGVILPSRSRDAIEIPLKYPMFRYFSQFQMWFRIKTFSMGISVLVVVLTFGVILYEPQGVFLRLNRV